MCQLRLVGYVGECASFAQGRAGQNPVVIGRLGFASSSSALNVLFHGHYDVQVRARAALPPRRIFAQPSKETATVRVRSLP